MPIRLIMLLGCCWCDIGSTIPNQLTRQMTWDFLRNGFLIQNLTTSNCDAWGPFYTYALQTWMASWYQKFLVPPPIPGENRTRVNVSISVTNIMDINEQVFIFSTKAMSDYLLLCRLILVILSCVVGWSLPSSILPCHELAGFKHYFQGETHIKQLYLRLSRTESTKWQALECWDSFRQLPFLKFCSCSCCLLTELEEPNKYEHPSD